MRAANWIRHIWRTASVIVDMTLMPKKTVEVKAETTGQLAPGYEIPEGGIVCDPAYVEIYGEASVLANITSIALEPCSISNMSSDVVELYAYVPPEGVTVLDADNKAQVTITIREEMREETFNGVGMISATLATASPHSLSRTRWT